MKDGSSKYHSSDGRPLTAAEIARLDEIEAQVGDAEDVLETSDSAWATAVVGKHRAGTQGVVPVRLDADVAAWLRGKGEDTQAEINRILRERMRAESHA